MIEKITLDNCKIKQLEKIFKNYFINTSVKEILLNNEFTSIFTFVEDNKIVAFIVYDLLYERCELTQIEVLEKYRNKNIASKLLTHMIKDCMNKGIENITLEVKITNDVAINLYKRFGFKKVAIRKGYYQGVDAILMEKEMIE